MNNIIKPFYFIYQWFIAGPVFIVVTVITAIITAVGSTLGNKDFWGYWPPHYWSRFTCWIFLMRVKVNGRENIDKNTSYVFVANHQGAYDICAIYGFLNNKFIWLMNKEL